VKYPRWNQRCEPLRLRVASRLMCGLLAMALVKSLLAAPPALDQVMPIPTDVDRFDRSMRRALLPNGITIGYADLGPRDGMPIVLIHGYTNNARSWLPLLAQLDAHFRLILVDLRGHGLSSKPECCYDRVDLAYDVRLLLDRLGIPRAAIVGHSLGSIVAQTFAEYWPDRTERVVLISSSGGARPGCGAGDAINAPPLPWLRAALVQMKDPIDPDSQFMSDWYGATKPSDLDVLRRQRRDAAAIPVRVWLAVLDQAITGVDLQSTLPRLTAPSLLLWGAKDVLMGERDRCSLRAALPAAQVKIFAEYGHNPFWEDPVAVAAVLNPFLISPR
jgi:pimeloyl-ACP methyl ester carboxylesterase